jgi:hypothetical protein
MTEMAGFYVGAAVVVLNGFDLRGQGDVLRLDG